MAMIMARVWRSTARSLYAPHTTRRIWGSCVFEDANQLLSPSIPSRRSLSTVSESTTTPPVTSDEFALHLHKLGLSPEAVQELFLPQVQQASGSPSGRFPFAVALSGGADSMALMLLLTEFLSLHNVQTPLLAITVDHALRTESGDEARYVGEITTAKWGVHHVTMRCDWTRAESGGAAPRKSKLQEEARSYRYKLLSQACVDHGVRCLFVAHNLGDQLETVLFRLGRGSGINGLAGISADSVLVDKEGDDNKQVLVKLLRPLLNVSKASLKATCERFQQPWVEDPSNESLVFDRIRIRKTLEEIENGSDGERDIAVLRDFHAAAARAKREFQEREQSLMNEFVVHETPSAVVMSSRMLVDERCFDELAIRILTNLVRRVRGKTTPPRLSSLEGLLRDLRTLGSGKKVTLSGCCITKRNRGRELHFEREQPAKQQRRS